MKNYSQLFKWLQPPAKEFTTEQVEFIEWMYGYTIPPKTSDKEIELKITNSYKKLSPVIEKEIIITSCSEFNQPCVNAALM